MSAGRPWTAADDANLQHWHSAFSVEGVTTHENWCAGIGVLLKRSGGAVKERLRRLGLKPRKDLLATRICRTCLKYRERQRRKRPGGGTCWTAACKCPVPGDSGDSGGRPSTKSPAAHT